MRVTIIRHAIAVPAGTEGIADNERPLTKRGKKRFRAAARGLARVCRRPDVLLTSPLPRAAATARIAAKAWGGVEATIEPALAGGTLDDVLAALARYPDEHRVALVGHEPMLSALVARLLGGLDGARVALRKGGVAQLEVPTPPGDGGTLVWFLRPRILRALDARRLA